MKNARFWEWLNFGWVKITLKPGHRLEYHGGRQTEEGYYRHSESWEHVGNGIESCYCEWGRDCDGAYERGAEAFCPLEELAARDMNGINEIAENIGIRSPEWQKVKRHQRDYAAEAAGY